MTAFSSEKLKVMAIAMCIVICFIIFQFFNMAGFILTSNNIYDSTEVVKNLNENDSFRSNGIEKLKNKENLNKKLEIFFNNSSNELEYIYFEHIRKSGGTTMKDILGLREYRSDIKLNKDEIFLTELGKFRRNFLSKSGIFIHNERRSFPFSCLNTPRATKTLFVTLIRDPIERWQSEFVYTGAYIKYLRALVNEETDTLNILEKMGGIKVSSLVELNETKYGLIILNNSLSQKEKVELLHEDKYLLYNRIKHWMKGEKDNPIWKQRSVIGSYVPNMTTRFLSGNCECLAMREDILPYHIHDTSSLELHRVVTGCPEGDRVFDNLNEKDLEMAKKVVDNFGAAMPFELLRQRKLLTDWLNYAASKKNLRFEFSQSEPLRNKKSSSTKKFVDIMQFSDLAKIFEEENALDTELHQYVLSKYEEFKPTLLKYKN